MIEKFIVINFRIYSNSWASETDAELVKQKVQHPSCQLTQA